MKRTQRFEQVIDIPDQLASQIHDITEEDSTIQPRMERDVYQAASLYGRAAFLLYFGLGLAALLILHAYYDPPLEDLALVAAIALGLAIMLAAVIYLVALNRQMAWYKRHVKRRRTYGLAVEEPTVREFQRLATNPNVLRSGRYEKWTEKKKRALARRLVDEDGHWIGGERFVRDKHIKGIIENYTVNWDLITADFEQWGWIVNQNQGTDKDPIWLFTAFGRRRITAWLEDPPN
jgi:hypothetical protein